MTRIATHLRTNVVGYVALFVALSAGAYAAGLAPNSVKSRHIKNGHVKNADLAANAVTSSKVADLGLTGSDLAPGSVTGSKVADLSLTGSDLAPGSVTGSKVADLSLTGSDLAANSVGGQQIDESSLGAVAMAAQGGTGRYGFLGDCDPEGFTYVACSTAAVPHSKPGRLLIIGQVSAATEVDSDNARGQCRIEVDEAPISASHTEFYFHDTGTPIGQFGLYGTENATLVAVSDVLPAGTQTAGVACNQNENTGAIRYPRVRMVGVSLSNG